MAFKCLDCGNIFEYGEEARWEEKCGEYWGIPCSQEVSGCPLCHGDYEKTFSCKICGEEFLQEELNGGVCNECVDNYLNDTQTCLSFGEKEKEEIELNSFLLSVFSVSQIEEILSEELKKAEQIRKIDCSNFINNDRDWFGSMLAEEVNKNENAKS